VIDAYLQAFVEHADREFAAISEADFQRGQNFARLIAKSEDELDDIDRVDQIWRRLLARN
jgi:hypothetical protein